MIRLKLAERFKRGAAFLTRRVDKHWKARINLNTLDINLPQTCMLGQTDGDFFEHKEELGLSDKKAADYGFIGYSTLDINGRIRFAPTISKRHAIIQAEHRRLTNGWVKYITARI